uniref:Uncharacterized protein n=1 Tax=Arundo donax TaxID=35708 RepID=A0A0A8ZYP1_ARUDO
MLPLPTLIHEYGICESNLHTYLAKFVDSHHQT